MARKRMFKFEEIVTPPLMTAADIGAMLLDEAVYPLARLVRRGALFPLPAREIRSLLRSLCAATNRRWRSEYSD
jgi:hypothetical protein